jgi:hypothetical protein
MIVGFLGIIGSGKGTAGELLAADGFTPVSFAKILKDAVAVIFGWPRHLLEGDTPESRAFREQPDEYWSAVLKKTITPRLVLQWMGTEAGRNVFGKDLWVGALLRSLDTTKDYVITDVRFPNEIEMVMHVGGKLAQIMRGERPAWYSTAVAINEANNWDGTVQTMPQYPEVHYSEWAWIGHPLLQTVIRNDGTVQELQVKITEYAKR